MMKKWFFFLFASMFLCSCSCLLSQIPPQYIYAGSGCTASIPDYKSQVTVTGGCTGFTITQTPAAGFLLTSANKTTNVVIKATGTNSKSSQVSFTVTMLDTVTPKITPNASLLAYKTMQLVEVQDAADRMAISMLTPIDTAKKLLVTISKVDPATGERDHIVQVAKTVEVDRNNAVDWKDIYNLPPIQYQTDQIDWARVVNRFVLDSTIVYLVNRVK